MNGRLQRVCSLSTAWHMFVLRNPVSKDAKKTEAEKAEEADAEILAAIASRKKLASDLELAKGVQYTEPLKTSYVSLHVLPRTHRLKTLDGAHQSSYASGVRRRIRDCERSTTFWLMAKTFLHP